MTRYDDTLTIKTLFGTAEIVYVPEQSVPESTCPAGIFGTTPAYKKDSHYLATFIDGDFVNAAVGRHDACHSGAYDELLANAAKLYAVGTYRRHIADEETKNIQPITERHAAVIADGSALWLDAAGNKLIRRQFTNEEVAVKLNLNKPVTRQRCAALCAKFGVRVMRVNDWRYFHRDNGVELDDAYMRLHCEEGGYRTEKTDYIYFAASDTLQIWRDDVPVSEDAAGVICDDKDALADSLM